MCMLCVVLWSAVSVGQDGERLSSDVVWLCSWYSWRVTWPCLAADHQSGSSTTSLLPIVHHASCRHEWMNYIEWPWTGIQGHKCLIWISWHQITVSHGSAYTVIRATQQVNGKWQFWGCQNSVTHEPIHKIWHTWLRRWVDLVCQIS